MRVATCGDRSSIGRASDCGSEGCGIIARRSHWFRGQTAEPPACHAGDSRVSTGRDRHSWDASIGVMRRTLNPTALGSTPRRPTILSRTSRTPPLFIHHDARLVREAPSPEVLMLSRKHSP